jgi:hypothetical protein
MSTLGSLLFTTRVPPKAWAFTGADDHLLDRIHLVRRLSAIYSQDTIR